MTLAELLRAANHDEWWNDDKQVYVFVKGVAQSVYKGYVSPGEYAMGLRKIWQNEKKESEA